MQKLIEGVHSFHRETFRHQRELFDELALRQTPEVLFITCADSRIVPNTLTNTGAGDLFIIRNAGNIVPPAGSPDRGVEATIEYAVQVLGIKDIIVCGHSNCGAMRALIDPRPLESLPAMRDWLEYAAETRKIVAKSYQHLEGEARVMAAVEENVLEQLDHVSHLPSVAPALARGAVKLHGWVYKIKTGEVFHYDPSEGQYLSLDDQDPKDAPTPFAPAVVVDGP